VSEVRTGTGLLAAVQLKRALADADASLAGRVAKACRDEGGTITCALAGGGLQISPPLVITEEQFAELAAGLRTGLDAVGGTPAGSSQVTSGLGRRGRDRAGREQCATHTCSSVRTSHRQTGGVPAEALSGASLALSAGVIVLTPPLAEVPSRSVFWRAVKGSSQV